MVKTTHIDKEKILIIIDILMESMRGEVNMPQKLEFTKLGGPFSEDFKMGYGQGITTGIKKLETLRKHVEEVL